MKTSKILPWIIFGLVLVLAWMTLGRASSYYVDAVVAPPTTPGTVTTPTKPPPPPSGTVPATVPTVASAPVPTGPASKYNMKSGFDFPHNTLSMYPTNNPDSCAALCDASSKCAGYVLDTQSPMCMLKSYFGTSATSTLRNSYSKPGISLA
jgi:hypothetical protein